MPGSDDPKPRRLRWSVPPVDTSTNQWLDKQADISQSLRLLIREAIRRDGYIDVVNRPVEQDPPQEGADDETNHGSQQHHHEHPRHPDGNAQPEQLEAEPRAAGVHGAAVQPKAAQADTEPQTMKQPKNPDAAAGIAKMLDMTR